MDERIEQLRRRLEDAIRSLPEGFYDTFKFTTTGKNLCHPVTLGLLAKVVGEMDGIGYVGVDVRLNAGKGLKFQPDIVGYRDAEGLQNDQAVIFVDFESPNSCDARIPKHHLEQYLAWVKDPKPRAPYVIVTSLPDAPAPSWELRYTSELNKKHKRKLKQIRDNPYQYWTTVWKKDLRVRPKFSDIYFLNINRDKVTAFQMP
jgi:hypothetical protein